MAVLRPANTERADELPPLDPPADRALVARRRHLPGLRAQLRRRRRRRHRRPAGHHAPGSPPRRPRASTRCGYAVLPLAAADHGYDVADYRDVEPVFGTLADFDALVADAHALGLRVIVDIVPNHTSERARVVPGGAGRRARQPRAGALRVPRRRGRRRRAAAEQLGVGLRRRPAGPESAGTGSGTSTSSTRSQPDLNWAQPRGRRRVRATCCGSGSTAASTASASTSPTAWSRPAGLPDVGDRPRTASPVGRGRASATGTRTGCTTSTARGARSWTPTPASGCSVGEAWVADPERAGALRRPDELHQAFNFDFLPPTWDADGVPRGDRRRRWRAAAPWARRRPGCCRTTTSCGTPPGTAAAWSGCARARAAALLMLALPGSAYLYQGEELGLERGATCPTSDAGPRRSSTDRPGPRRMPGADAVDGRRAAVRLRAGRGPALAPAARRLGARSPWRPRPRTRTRRSAFYRAALARRRELLAAGWAQRARADWLDLGDDVLAFARGRRHRAW